MARSYHKGEEPVPGYRLLEPLGRGGFGEVWKATGPGGIPVALKLIPLSGKHGFKELRAIQRVKLIRHPNLVPITAFWLKDEAGEIMDDAAVDVLQTAAAGAAATPSTGRQPAARTPARKPYELIMAMGLGDKSLSDRLEECTRAGGSGIPLDELLGYMEDAARAIDHLNSPRHDLGAGPVAIQHCDIKPQNIMIVGGAAQVCDFGLARVLGDIRTTSAAMSPAYAAPECLKDNKPSEFTDQYSLAISYCELRTGVLPFDSDSYLDVVNAHLQGTLDLSKLTEAERTVIHRATAVNPKDRYPTTLAMVRALRQAAEPRKVAPAPRPAARPGEVLPGHELVTGYKLVRLIVQNGSDEVWEALAPGGKPVALLVRRLTTPTARLDFLALDLLEGIDHLHITEPHAFWLLDSQGVVLSDEQRWRPDAPPPSMLVIAGKLARKNLADRLNECRRETGSGIPQSELMDYMRQLASALDFLNAPQHRWGESNYAIFHRDVRPPNILLAGSTIRLGNFSLARVAEEPNPLVQTSPAGLDPRYAAPETQIGLTTRWSDQYALAITYYQLLTGSLPFDERLPAADLAEIHQQGKLKFARLSDRLVEVLARATATAPEDRFACCDDLVEALEEAAGVARPEPGRPSSITPPPAPRPTTEFPPIVPAAPATIRETQRPIAETAELRGTMIPQPAAQEAPAPERRIHAEIAATPPTRTTAPPPTPVAAAEVTEAEAAAPAPPSSFGKILATLATLACAAAIVIAFFALRKPPVPSPPTPPRPITEPEPLIGPDQREITKAEPVPEPPRPDRREEIRREISTQLKERQFAQALRSIQGASEILGDESQQLLEQALTDWVAEARRELNEGDHAKASSTSLAIIEAATDFAPAYLTLCDALLAADDAVPQIENLRVLWKAPAVVLSSRELIDRLSALQGRWLRGRLPTLEKASDYAALLAEITTAESAVPEAMSGWTLAAKAECMVEKGDGKLTAAEWDLTNRTAADSRVAAAGGYGSYVQGLLLQAHAEKSDAPARKMIEVSDAELETPIFNPHRRSRMAAVLATAAQRLKRPPAPRETRLAGPDQANNPFGSQETAEAAARYLERSIRLTQQSGTPVPVTLRWSLAQAAWFKPEPDRDRVRALTDALLADPARSQLDTEMLPLLLLNVAAQPDSPEGNLVRLQRYATILDLLDRSYSGDMLDPSELFHVLIEPATKVAADFAKSDPADAEQRRAIAHIYASRGQLIVGNWYESWPFDDKSREAIESFKQAVRFDDSQAEYFSGLALAQSHAPKPDLEDIRKNADQAVKLDENRPIGHGMLGYALLLQSRVSPSPVRVANKLHEAIASIEKAITLTKSQEGQKRYVATYLINASTAYVELVPVELARSQREEYLKQAQSCAESALAANSRYPELARAALGNAIEALGTSFQDGDKLDEAIQVYRDVIDARPASAAAWFARGRCRYKRAAQQPDRSGIDEAIADLEKAMGLDPSEAQIPYWLAKAQALRRDPVTSDALFLKALQLADEQNNPSAWARLAEDYALTALLDVRAGILKQPPEPAQVQRLERFRAWAREQKQSPAKTLLASWMLGQSFELERKFRDALKEYDDALPRDLSQAEPRHIKLLLARSQCRSASSELWGEDLRRADASLREPPRPAEPPTPRPPILRPTQAILDADRAAELAEEDPFAKVLALTVAAVARTTLANDRPGTTRELDLRLEAVRQLTEALDIAPTLPESWLRRERLARYLKAIYQDTNLKIPEPKRQTYRNDALQQLDLALAAPEPNREARGRLAGLRAEIASR